MTRLPPYLRFLSWETCHHGSRAPQSTPPVLPTPLPATQNFLEGAVPQAWCSELDLSSQICWESFPPSPASVTPKLPCSQAEGV